MPGCAIPTCRLPQRKKTKELGITFHIFPQDEVQNSKWLKIVRKARLDPYWKPHKGSVICSKHFDTKYFYKTTKCGLQKLTKEAIPTKEIAMYVSEEEVLQETEPDTLPSTSNNIDPEPKNNQNILKTDYKGDILDSPEKLKLKKELDKQKKICIYQKRIIRNLKLKTKRLVKKNESLKNILKNLKNSRYVGEDV